MDISKMATVLRVLLVGVLCAARLAWADDTGTHQQQLSKLKNQTLQKEQELQKYRDQEKKISKEVSALQTKKQQADQLKNKVEKDISLVEQNLLSIEEKRTALHRSMPMWQQTVWEEAATYYLNPSCTLCAQNEPLETQLFIDTSLTQHSAFALTLQQENQNATDRFANFTARNKQLQAENSKLKKEQADLAQTFQKKKKDLDAAKQKVEEVRREINELNKSAAELNKLLASFERKRKNEPQKTPSATAAKNAGPKISVPPHSLPWPVKGQVVSKFGKEYRADLNTWIFRDGIKISSSFGAPVRASADGSVIYAGPFRSYGNVVIMDHGKGFFTIYGFLHEMNVAVGDQVSSQEQVGTVGKDTQASSGTGKYVVYFEIRQGTTAVDPLMWLK